MAKGMKAFRLAMIFMLFSGLTAFSASLPVQAGDYPSLSEKELGHVQWLVKLAQQPLGGLDKAQTFLIQAQG